MHLCGDNSQLTGTNPEELQRQLRKKQKNRAAAQRSRQKHTDKADTLHQQHESLERHNQALRKEIQALQAELAWWSWTLHLHTHLCPTDCASCPTPGPPGCWSHAECPPGLAPHERDCQEQSGMFQNPMSSSPTQQLSPGPRLLDSPGLFSSPPPAGSLASGPAVMTAQLSPSPVLDALPAGSSLTGSSKLKVLLSGPAAQPGPAQPLGLGHSSGGKLGSPTSYSPGLTCLQELGMDPDPHPLLAFPLLSSAQVHF
ncbi:basic leucine zipper transcriptional factor ATF-like 2 isoform X1 [Ochotona princeps]|uniref:basic leucine zipper transcriptional factor ATF-like 2 isoform X1 n=1 Tax=Ochotona princeps TaxID=9978 RepID=UPI0027146259|nr:basic leucine zipper transcriptional factor ATF-like 2 isoform X1 [Ochotona princeps]